METTPIVYQYGLLAPDRHEHVKKQMLLAHRYQNRLIEIELQRRDKYRALRADLVPRIAELEQLEATCMQAVTDAVDKTDKAAAKAALKMTRAELRAERTAAKDNAELARRAQEINAEALALSKTERAGCGVYWGTYLLAEAAVEAAKKHPQPRFRRWRGEGRVGVQIQGGIPVEKVFACTDTRLRIEPVTEEAFVGPRGARRRAMRTKLWLRVGSEGRDPVWAVFPMLLHKPLPEDGVIKEVSVSLRMVGTRERWLVNILVQQPKVVPVLKGQRGTVAIDLGWRKRPEGIRAAYWVDSLGQHGELVMPTSIRDRIQHAASLRSIQDRLFNHVRTRLVRWIDLAKDQVELNGSGAKELPEWLLEARRTLPLWRSQGRLTRLALYWLDNRFPGDEVVVRWLDAWRRKARHLYQWECSERTRALGHRREVYRIEAARLCDTYERIVIETFNLAKMKKVKDKDPDSVAPPPQRSQLHDTSPGEFRLAVENAARRRGIPVVALSSIGTTTRCHHCGNECKFNRDQLFHTCEHCGTLWDQDFNAASNLLELSQLEQQDSSAA